jgi:N-acetylmuramoyl-L-alanine amidase
MTAAQYAPKVLQAGVDLGITPKGIVIGFATVFVESDWVMYANASVPASMSLPYDAVGSDSASVGLFQQQVVGPPWWWGDAATCMDPYKSAQLFFTRLAANTDYNSDANTPGSYAQAIQGSAFPDRYDEHMADAQALYNSLTSGGTPPVSTPTTPAQDPRLTALQAARPDFNEYPVWVSENFESRQSTPVDLWLIHTEETSGYDDADGLAHYLESTTGTDNPVSYHYTISKGQNDDGVTVCDVVDTDDASWSVGNSNLRSINLCFADSTVDWTTSEWDNDLGRCIDVAAYLFVQDSIKYNIGSNVIPGPAYGQNPPGLSDHRYCTDYLKDGNTHTDVGDNFHWALLQAAVAKYWAIANVAAVPPPTTTPPDGGTTTTPPAAPDFDTWLASASDHDILTYIAGQLGPGDPTWTSTDETQDTLRDFLWAHLATAVAKKKAKAT